MQPVHRRDAGVWHQTRSLLYKNLLIKWRTKQQSLQVPSFQQSDMNCFALVSLISDIDLKLDCNIFMVISSDLKIASSLRNIKLK